jgi:hypothetical protein
MNRFALAAFILAAGSTPALAHASAFDGTWKLDVAKSKFTGDTFTYAKTATGYSYSNGATVSYAFAADGKDYPTLPSRTVAWTKNADGSWDVVTKANGKVVTKTHRSLSADGKTLTAAYTEYWPNGSTVHESDVYTRVSGTSGLAGKWRNTKANVASDSITIKTSSGGHFEIDTPSLKETVTGLTNGAPVAVKAPNAPPGAMAAYKAAGPSKWTYNISLGGKIYVSGAKSVSADGKTLTDTSWVPGKESEASVAVYAKQ